MSKCKNSLSGEHKYGKHTICVNCGHDGHDSGALRDGEYWTEYCERMRDKTNE